MWEHIYPHFTDERKLSLIFQGHRAESHRTEIREATMTVIVAMTLCSKRGLVKKGTQET
jgi:hypothetical protein